jgi:hypothetical protein
VSYIRLVLVLVVLVGISELPPLACGQSWTKSLKAEYGLRAFNRSDFKPWTRQQGIRFITADLIAVYQVSRTERRPELQARDESGGGGSFRINIVFVNIRDGRQVTKLELPTNGEISSVLPTHDGNFLVRTGNIVHLYSAAFEQISSKHLPLGGNTRLEWWEVRVTPSGNNILLAHHRDFGFKQESKVDLQLLNADTLQDIRSIPVSLLLGWSAGDDFIVSEMPNNIGEVGVMNFAGQRIASVKAREDCPHSSVIQALAMDRTAQILCREDLFIRSLGSEVIFSRQLTGREVFVSVASAANMLAAAIERPTVNLFDTGKPLQPLRIALYDLSRQRELLSAKVKHVGFQYDVSSNGGLAIVDGEMMSIYSAPLGQ